MNEELEGIPIDNMPQASEPMDERVTSERSGNYGTLSEKRHERSKGEMLRDHIVEIRFLSVGCVIRVGCKEIPFEDRNRAMIELLDYVRDPHTATKKWNQKFNQKFNQ